MILPRYSIARLLQSRFLVGFRILLPAVSTRLRGTHLSVAQSVVSENVQHSGREFIEVNAKFFLVVSNIQAAFAYFMTAFVGPSLVSPDLTNNALPLYFCRPFSRTEYVLGKMSVLMYTALADHLGSDADSVRHSGEPGGLGMDSRRICGSRARSSSGR